MGVEVEVQAVEVIDVRSKEWTHRAAGKQYST